MATQTAISDPIGEPSALLPMGLQATYDATVTEMLHRIELTMDKAIETSAELWPDRITGCHDAAGYFQWHKKVCPSGTAHLSSGPVLQDNDLYIKAKSIAGLTEGLISMVDHFHSRSAGVPGPSPVANMAEGVSWRPITSLGAFFRPLRTYVV